jgi:transcriptional regulator of heat shock response
MDQRQKVLLRLVVELYIDTAQPVGSLLLAAESDLDVSPATIRNELLELEDKGLIYQPHTSAGRVPTIKGLKYYLDSLMQTAATNDRTDKLLQSYKERWGLRGVAKLAAEVSETAAVMASDLSDYFYTGFSRLFAQPEFMDARLVQSLSRALDRLDDVLPAFFGQLPARQPTIFLGRHNPFGPDCSAIFVSNGSPHGETIMGLLTPIRTNYAGHVKLLEQAVKYLD